MCDALNFCLSFSFEVVAILLLNWKKKNLLYLFSERSLRVLHFPTYLCFHDFLNYLLEWLISVVFLLLAFLPCHCFSTIFLPPWPQAQQHLWVSWVLCRLVRSCCRQQSFVWKEMLQLLYGSRLRFSPEGLPVVKLVLSSCLWVQSPAFIQSALNQNQHLTSLLVGRLWAHLLQMSL